MPSVSEFSPRLCYPTVTIASGQTTSGAIDLLGGTLCGVYLPASFTGTTLKFHMAPTIGGTYQATIDGAGSDITKTVAQGKYLRLNPADFAGVQFLKVVSGSSEGADRTLTLAVRPV